LTRPPHWVKSGPKKGHGRLTTRAAAAIAKMARQAKGKMLRIPVPSLARTLDCNPEYLVQKLRVLRDAAWFFKVHHTIILLTNEKAEDCRTARWTLWAINRHHVHRIYARPGKWRRLRWHLLKGSPGEWEWYTRRIFKWAHAMIFSKEKRRDREHKGYSPATSRERAGGARSPTEDRAAYRRFGAVAAACAATYGASPQNYPVKLHGWCVNRLSEWHDRARIVAELRFATALLVKRLADEKAPPVENPHSWICGVASYRLNRDGFTAKQRQAELREAGALPRAAERKAFKDSSSDRHATASTAVVLRNCFEPGPRPVYVDGNGVRWLLEDGKRIRIQL
jgi:hypothetical protein